MSACGGFQPLFLITHRMTAGLTRIERARGFLDAAPLGRSDISCESKGYEVLRQNRDTYCDRASARRKRFAYSGLPSAPL
jgi:hypothetical protein